MTTVRIDDELCQGNGICEMRSPEVFELIGDGPATVKNPHPPIEQMASVQAAERGCPMQAVLLEDDLPGDPQ